ncbi:MAG: hypothetical protein DGJ47_000461 [Rickettsiaceae bacterium]
MSVITIGINNKKFTLSCSAENHKRLLESAAKLDSDVKEIIANNKHISFEFALVMTALQLMDFKNKDIKITGGEAVAKIESEHQNQLKEVSHALSKILSQ